MYFVSRREGHCVLGHVGDLNIELHGQVMVSLVLFALLTNVPGKAEAVLNRPYDRNEGKGCTRMTGDMLYSTVLSLKVTKRAVCLPAILILVPSGVEAWAG